MGDFFDESHVYHTPFGTTMVRPEWICNSTTTFSPENYSLSGWRELSKKAEKEAVGDVEVFTKKSDNAGEHIVACNNKYDLTIDRILKTLSAVKGKLMLDVAPIHIKEIQCKMTPAVRKNIIAASKKLRMYGKKPPIIARFDEYGNRLPDEIDLETSNGITLTIVEPELYGEFYIELKAIEFSSYYQMNNGYEITSWDGLPF